LLQRMTHGMSLLAVVADASGSDVTYVHFNLSQCYSPLL
jgi:hypothetical protein